MRPDEFVVPASEHRLRKSCRDALAQAGGLVAAGGGIVVDVSMIVLDDPCIAGPNPCECSGGGHQKNSHGPTGQIRNITEAFATRRKLASECLPRAVQID